MPTPPPSECADVRDFGWKVGGAAHFAPGNKNQLASRNPRQVPVSNHCWLDLVPFPLQVTDVGSLLSCSPLFSLSISFMHGYPCVCVPPFYTHWAVHLGFLCSASHVIYTALTEWDRVLALLLNKHIPVSPHQKVSVLAEKIRGRINHLALWLCFPTGRSPVEICNVRIHSCCCSHGLTSFIMYLLWKQKD